MSSGKPGTAEPQGATVVYRKNELIQRTGTVLVLYSYEYRYRSTGVAIRIIIFGYQPGTVQPSFTRYEYKIWKSRNVLNTK